MATLTWAPFGSLDAMAGDVASEMILMAMGSSGRSHLWGIRTACRRLGTAMVSDMYSPLRVTAEPKRSHKEFRHPISGFALDLTVNDLEDGQPRDFSRSERMNKALKMVRRNEPFSVFGSPHCTAFSTWPAPSGANNSNPEEMRRAKARAIKRIELMLMMCGEQLSGGRYFLHEHPVLAASWQLSRHEGPHGNGLRRASTWRSVSVWRHCVTSTKDGRPPDEAYGLPQQLCIGVEGPVAEVHGQTRHMPTAWGEANT